MRRLRDVLLVSLVLTSVVEAADAPRVLQVAADGSAEFRTIQAAIDAAPQYGTVRVAAGTYPEPLSINKHLTLEGAGWQTTHVRGRWIDFRNVDVAELSPERRQRHAEIIEILKTSDGERYGNAVVALSQEFGPKPTLVVSGASVRIRGLRFSMLGPVQAGGWMSAAMVEFDNAKARVSECAFVGSAVSGWQVTGATDIECRDSLFAGIRVKAIDARLPPTSRLLIERSEFRRCGYHGISVRGDGQLEIMNCRIAASVHVAGGNPARVHDNLLVGHGLSTTGSDQVTIEHNTFVRLPEPKPPVFKPNFAIHATGGSRPTICANLAVGFEHAVELVEDASQHDTIVGNLFHTTAAPCARWIKKPKPADAPASPPFDDKFTFVKEECPLPPGNSTAAIRLVDAEHDDFTISAETPLPVKGVGASAFHRRVPPLAEAPEETQLWQELQKAEAARR